MKRTWLVVAVMLACTDVPPANAQLAPSALAYTQIYFGPQWTPFGTVETPLGGAPGPYSSAPTWSPDGQHVAYLSAGDIMVMDATGRTVQNITNSGSTELGVAWSPDGRTIAFASDRDGAPELYLMNPDGSGVVRLTTHVGLVSGFLSFRPTWSPDNTRLAFTCQVEAGNDDICMIRSDGTGFLRLTNLPTQDYGPAWSPDGRSIVFTRSPSDSSGPLYETNHELVSMSADGTSVSPLGVVGWDPTWSPDGSQIAFAGYGWDWTAVYVMNVDGTGIRWLGDYAEEPAWMPGSALIPYITVQCSGLVCSFDASESIGAITNYSWNFGDGTTASGVAASHTYANGGTFSVVLSLSGANGLTATRRHGMILNILPVAAFTVSCGTLTCVFDWSGSYDPDSHHSVEPSWDFGDGTGSCHAVPEAPKQCAHTYPAAGRYTTTLRVYDRDGASTTASQTLTIVAPSMHVGDLDGTSTQQGSTWTANVAITMHDSDHRPVANAVVSASWNDGTAVSCTTDTTGGCLLSKSRIANKASATVTVSNAVDGKHSYTPAGNHDPDGDSNGITIRLSKR